jgi:hypothetical protein
MLDDQTPFGRQTKEHLPLFPELLDSIAFDPAFLLADANLILHAVALKVANKISPGIRHACARKMPALEKRAPRK